MKKQYTAFPHLQHDHMASLMQCYSACCSCEKMCIEEGHKETAKLCSDCADICALTIKMHSADSEFNSKIAELCAQICKRCADACGKVQADHCKQCSEICKECAEACKGVALA